MEKEELRKLDTEALNKKISSNKMMGGLLLGASIFILILLGEKTRRTGEFNYMELIIPLCCLATLPFIRQEQKNIKAELETRK